MERHSCPNCGATVESDDPYCPECWRTRKDKARETSETNAPDESVIESDEQGDEQTNEPNQSGQASKPMTPRRIAAAAIQYGLGGFYFLLAIGGFTFSIIPGLAFLVGMVILLPVSRRFIERQFNISIPTGVVVFVTVATFLIGTLSVPTDTDPAQGVILIVSLFY